MFPFLHNYKMDRRFSSRSLIPRDLTLAGNWRAATAGRHWNARARHVRARPCTPRTGPLSGHAFSDVTVVPEWGVLCFRYAIGLTK